MLRYRRSVLHMVIGLVGVIAVACGASTALPTDVPASEQTQSSNPASVSSIPVPDLQSSGATSSTDPVAQIANEVAESQGYDSNKMMFRVFPGFDFTTDQTYKAFETVVAENDTSQVPILVESIRFNSSANLRAAAADTLTQLTGQTFGPEEWKEWMEWLGENRANYPPPEKYLDWKIDIMGQIDTRFIQFLSPAKELTLVDPTEVVWGGVIPDGIPDLRDPKTISPDEATYLESDERVFGISINGESKAYPLRIINAHEMANDVVGGQPIALSW